MRVRRIGVMLAVCVLWTLGVSEVFGQEPGAEAPRTSWGASDLQGVWDFRSLTPMQRPEELAETETFTDEQAAAFAVDEIGRRSRDSETSARAARARPGQPAGGDPDLAGGASPLDQLGGERGTPAQRRGALQPRGGEAERRELAVQPFPSLGRAGRNHCVVRGLLGRSSREAARAASWCKGAAPPQE